MRGKFKKDYWIIKFSGLFDSVYYLRQNPDVRNADVDPLEHFVMHGLKEGRKPNEWFDSLINEELMYNIDSLILKKKRIYGWGWIFHKTKKIDNIIFLCKKKNREYKSILEYGLPREDVFESYQIIEAKYSGFIININMEMSFPDKFYLQIKCNDNSVYAIDVTDIIDVKNHSNFNLCKFNQWIRISLIYLIQKNYRQLYIKIYNKIKDLLYKFFIKFRKNDKTKLFKKLLKENNQNKEMILIIDHNLGGGANKYSKQLISELKHNKIVLHLFYDLRTLSYWVNWYNNDECKTFYFETCNLLDIFKDIQIKEIFVNNLYSFEDPLIIIHELLTLKKNNKNIKISLAIHDYFCICPSYNLLDYKNEYCNIPKTDICVKCLQHHNGEFKKFYNYNNILLWREMWYEFLTFSDSIICFSKSSQEILKKAYPEVNLNKISIIPHKIETLRKANINSTSSLHIGIVGTIYNTAKGEKIIKDLVNLIIEKKLPIKITIIGEIKNPPLFTSILSITGKYTSSKLPEIIEKSGVNIFFFPSIWPETFSYVVHELMSMNLPIVAFNIGAQAEYLQNYPNSRLIPDIDVEIALQIMIKFFNELYKNKS
ncbi:MAG: glycosyltransferase [Spirochaetia bacterium]|nr:glycosyltransferase [Spirochaetota bacterium]MDW8113195.1 glycosyltransferase [Spirochaetia bacterium]